MYSRLLVALDGSELAERVLPHVEALASRFGSTVTLLWVITSEQMLGSSRADEVPSVALGLPEIEALATLEAERQDAEVYLSGVAQKLRGLGLTVNVEVDEGPAEQVLLERIRSLPADLVAMTTHGRSGLRRLVFGSVAEVVLRKTPCPILLIRVGGEHTRA